MSGFVLVAMTTICLTLILVSMAGYAQLQVLWTHFINCPRVTGQSFDDTTRIFDAQHVSRLDCMLVCANNIACKGVTYNTGLQECKHFNNSYPTCSNTTARFYVHARCTYKYIGCFNDYKPARVFGGKTRWMNMTNDICNDICISESPKNAYFATQNNKDCHCGEVDVPYDKHGQNICDETCVGDRSQICGGGSAIMSVYKINRC